MKLTAVIVEPKITLTPEVTDYAQATRRASSSAELPLGSTANVTRSFTGSFTARFTARFTGSFTAGI